jgi:predicted DCC family thiol-disulfide oxidoreductase YuxK
MTERLSDSFKDLPAGLTVVYDGDCLLCRRSVRWLGRQRPTVPIASLPSSAADAMKRFGSLDNYGDNMIVADDTGRVWVGPPDAYLVVMWAVPGLRMLSYLLSISFLKPLAGRAFQLVAGNRHAIGALLRGGCVHCRPGR